MPVVQINNVPSHIKPREMRALLEDELEVTRFYLRPREMLANGEFVKDGQYEVGFFETPDAQRAAAFVSRCNGLQIRSKRKMPSQLRGARWSLELLQKGWEAANQNQLERQEQRNSVFEHEMSCLEALNQQYLEGLLADRRHKAGATWAAEIRQTVPYIPYVPHKPRRLEDVSWASLL